MGGRRLNSTEIAQVVSMYEEEGKSTHAIGELLNRDQSGIAKVLKRAGVVARTPPPQGHDLSKRKFDRWSVLRYAGKKRGRHLWLCRCRCGTEREVDAQSLIRFLSPSCGCLTLDRVRPLGKLAFSRDRRLNPWSTATYCHNPSAFDLASDGPSPAQAFYAGLLFTDGSVSSRDPVVQLSLHPKDKGVIENLRLFIGSDHPIVESERILPEIVGKPYGKPARLANLSVYSKGLVASLAQYGVVPNKTYTACVPDFLLDNTHWWRGVVCGDGWLMIQSRDRPLLGLCGSPVVMEQFRQFVNRLPGKLTRGAVHRERAGQFCHRFAVCGEVAEKVIRALFANAPATLDRKQAIANRALARTRVYRQVATGQW